MRKLWTAALALVSALAFFMVASPSASAFGSELLGCDAGGFWSADTCYSTGTQDTYALMLVNFEAHNTSGTYSTSWAVTNGAGVAITQGCSVTYSVEQRLAS